MAETDLHEIFLFRLSQGLWVDFFLRSRVRL